MVFLDKKIIFLLPPKCGTSSFISLLKDNPKFDSDLIVKQDQTRHIRLSHIVRRNRIRNLQDYKIYQICRHPLNRLISSFYYIKPPISKDVKNPFSIINHYGKEYKFNEFLELILPFIISIKQKPPKIFWTLWNKTIKKDFKGIHTFFYQPQVYWNDLNANIEYIKLEDIIQDSSLLFPILGENTTKSFPFKNKNKGKNNKPKTPTLEMFTKQNLKLVYEAYEQDFKTLGYK